LRGKGFCERSLVINLSGAFEDARSRPCLFVRAGDALHKRASAYKALIRMSSVVLTWIAGKPAIRAHPISSRSRSARIYVIRRRTSCSGGASGLIDAQP
jgi:hypothetical protein